MNRILDRIAHNWPLKLAAVGLATLLYGGLIVTQSTQTLTGVAIRIDPHGLPDDSFLLTLIDPVTEIRYFSPAGTRPLSSDFEASIDLSAIVPGGGPQRVPVLVTSIDDRITVVSVQPAAVTVDLDRLERKLVDVVVDRGPIPGGLQLGEASISPIQAQVSGPASVIERVVAVRASIFIQPTGIDIDQDTDLVPIDEFGDAVGQVDVEPRAARIAIPVFSDRETRTLPINPVVTGDPAAGFEIAAIAVEPMVALVEGDADQLADLVRVDTVQIAVTGISAELTLIVGLDLPDGVLPVGDVRATVVITLRPVTATRNFSSGLRLVGFVPGFNYTPDADEILVTVGGSVADLDRLSGRTLVVELDVTGLEPGSQLVPVTLDLPAGLTLVSASPPNVLVTIVGPPPSPSASPAASPTVAPSPSG